MIKMPLWEFARMVTQAVLKQRWPFRPVWHVKFSKGTISPTVSIFKKWSSFGNKLISLSWKKPKCLSIWYSHYQVSEHMVLTLQSVWAYGTHITKCLSIWYSHYKVSEHMVLALQSVWAYGARITKCLSIWYSHYQVSEHMVLTLQSVWAYGTRIMKCSTYLAFHVLVWTLFIVHILV